MALASGFTRALWGIVGRDYLSVDPGLTRRFSCCPSSFLRATPDAVVFPASTGEVAESLRGAAVWGVPVVQRCATSHVSAALAVRSGGIVLALDRMNQILDLDAGKGIAQVQPGVTADQLLSTYRESADDTEGGRFGNDAQGVGDWRVIGLEVVSPTGRIARTGADLLAAPVDEPAFRQLLAGPDGTFAVITELTLALDLPRPSSQLALAYFGSVAAACDGMRAVLDAGLLMSWSEFLERSCIAELEARASLGLRRDAAALPVFASDQRLRASSHALHRICEVNDRAGATHTAVATNAAWCDTLLRALREQPPRCTAPQKDSPSWAQEPTSERSAASELLARPSEGTRRGSAGW